MDQAKRPSPASSRRSSIASHHKHSSIKAVESPRFTTGPNPNHVRRDRMNARLAPEQRNRFGSQASRRSPASALMPSSMSSIDYSSNDYHRIRRFSPKYGDEDDYYADEKFDDDQPALSLEDTQTTAESVASSRHTKSYRNDSFSDIDYHMNSKARSREGSRTSSISSINSSYRERSVSKSSYSRK
jgi:hypothetical protein